MDFQNKRPINIFKEQKTMDTIPYLILQIKSQEKLIN